MLKKLVFCCTSIGTGIAMLANIGVGIAAGNAIAAALEGVARQPEAEGLIREGLMLSLSKISVLLIASFIIALILILMSLAFSNISCHEYSPSCICNSIGAGLAILGASGMAIGLGRAGAFLVAGIARQPEATGKLTALFKLSTPLLYFGILACVFIAAGIIFNMIITHCRCNPHHHDKED